MGATKEVLFVEGNRGGIGPKGVGGPVQPEKPGGKKQYGKKKEESTGVGAGFSPINLAETLRGDSILMQGDNSKPPEEGVFLGVNFCDGTALVEGSKEKGDPKEEYDYPTYRKKKVPISYMKDKKGYF